MSSVPYFPFDGNEYRPQMGLKPLELRDWIEVDSDYETYIQRKKELLNSERETVFQFRGEAEEIAFELFDVLKTHMNDHFAGLVGEIEKPASGSEAFFKLSQWTQEDWAILSPEAPVKLIAGSVCFPSRWSLKEKMEQGTGFIHAPVPGFNTIAKPAESFLERIPVDRAASRLNWTIHDSPELFCPRPHPSREDLTADDVLENTFLRVERQTLRRLPVSKGVIFSIRTYIHKLSDLTTEQDSRTKMHSTLRSLDPHTMRYKGMATFYEALLSALAKN